MGISILLSMQGGETQRYNDDEKAVTQEMCIEGGVIGVRVTWQRKDSVDAAVFLYSPPPPPGFEGQGTVGAV